MGNTYPANDRNTSSRGSVRVAERAPLYNGRPQIIQRSERTVFSITALAPAIPTVSALSTIPPLFTAPATSQTSDLADAVAASKSLQQAQAPKPQFIAQPRVAITQPSIVKSFGISNAALTSKPLLQQPAAIPNTHSSVQKKLSKTTNKALLLARSIENDKFENKKGKSKVSSKNLKHLFGRLIRKDIAVALTVALILSGTGYVSFDVWRTNNAVKSTLAPATASALANTPSTEHSQASEGKDTSSLPKNALTNYKVNPELPRAIYIKKLGVEARLLPMGVNTDSSLQAPLNIHDAGWYTSSAKPGLGGAIVVDGHASQTGTNYGLFSKLDTLVNGDQIIVERGDGTRFTYEVAHTETVPESEVDMNKVMLPYGSASQGLNLITCAGEWTKDGKTLDHRVLVFTTLVKNK